MLTDRLKEIYKRDALNAMDGFVLVLIKLYVIDDFFPVAEMGTFAEKWFGDRGPVKYGGIFKRVSEDD